MGVLLLLMLCSSCAFASTPMPWDSTLKTIGTALCSSTAFYIAVIAFAASALSMVWGNEMSDTMKKVAGTTVVVSFLVGVPGFLQNVLGIQVSGAEIAPSISHVPSVAAVLALGCAVWLVATLAVGAWSRKRVAGAR
jgi:type IV secretory pathway VirB2 component (pilin)